MFVILPFYKKGTKIVSSDSETTWEIKIYPSGIKKTRKTHTQRCLFKKKCLRRNKRRAAETAATQVPRAVERRVNTLGAMSCDLHD